MAGGTILDLPRLSRELAMTYAEMSRSLLFLREKKVVRSTRLQGCAQVFVRPDWRDIVTQRMTLDLTEPEPDAEAESMSAKIIYLHNPDVRFRRRG